MLYIIKIDTVRLLVDNENDARNLVSALLSSKLVDSNWKSGINETFTINKEYTLEVKSIEPAQVIDNKIKIAAPASFPDGDVDATPV